MKFVLVQEFKMNKKDILRILFLLFFTTSLNLNVYSIEEQKNSNSKVTTFVVKPNYLKIFRKQWVEKVKEIISDSVEKNKKNAKLPDGEKYVTAFEYDIGDHHSCVCSPGCTSIFEFKSGIFRAILEDYLRFRVNDLMEVASSKCLLKDELELVKREHAEIINVFCDHAFDSIVGEVDISSLNIPMYIMCMNDGRDYLNTDGKWYN